MYFRSFSNTFNTLLRTQIPGRGKCEKVFQNRKGKNDP